MATKQNQPKVDEKAKEDKRVGEQVQEDSRRSNAGEAPFSDPSTNPDEAREPKVGEKVETSFDERTSAAQPWLKKDGTQDNGARDLEEPEGARAPQSREGDKSTVEETEKAIEEGKVEGPQDVPGDDNDEAPKNPVK